MLRHLVVAVAAALACSAPALAQEQHPHIIIPTVKFLTFRHYDCPPVDPASEGGTPENPIDSEFFSRAWSNAYDATDADEPPNEKNRFECRWIRLTGFMMWDDILGLYPGRLYESTMTSYQRENLFYFIENFAAGAPPRGDLARRKLTVVGRFYDLCAAGRRELEARNKAGEYRDLGYPCHEIPAMMLEDVRVEKIHDATPQYLLGEANRSVMDSLVVATADEKKQVEPTFRTWLASVRRGLHSFATEYLAQNPTWDEERARAERARIESLDSYGAYLLRQERFLSLDLQTASVRVFRPVGPDGLDDDFDSAVGCVCLEASCTDRWPLTAKDAENFLGDAACVALDRWNGGPWQW